MRRVAGALAAVFVSGCYSGPGVESPYPRSAWPAGIYTAGRLRPFPVPPGVRGIYPSNPGDPFCCWVAKHSQFQVPVRPKAHAARLVLTLPDLPVFHRRLQTARVVIDGGPPFVAPGLGVGDHRVVVPLPEKHGSRVSVALDMAFAFVPKEEHVNGDTRALAIELRRVATQ